MRTDLPYMRTDLPLLWGLICVRIYPQTHRLIHKPRVYAVFEVYAYKLTVYAYIAETAGLI